MLRRTFFKMLASAAVVAAIPAIIVKIFLPVKNLNTGKEYMTIREAIDDIPAIVNESITIVLAPGEHDLPIKLPPIEDGCLTIQGSGPSTILK